LSASDPSRQTARRLLAAGVAAGVVLVAGLSLSGIARRSGKDATARRHAPRLADASFERSAGAVCRTAAHSFDAVTTLPKTPTRDQSADLLVAIDGIFATMVESLHGLRPPAGPADEAAVRAWLRDWDAYVEFGSRYAAAVRAGTDGELVKREGRAEGELRRHLRAFAAVNHMGACVFP